MTGLIFGASGMVGAYIAREFAKSGQAAFCVSRDARPGWVRADLTQLDVVKIPRAEIVFCATNARTFAQALPAVLRAKPRRVVVISSTSVFTKTDSTDDEERRSILELIYAEKQISNLCSKAAVEWTILRPTLIYREGRDRNITQIARIIRRLRWMPLYGGAKGLRQPVHAEDLARGAIAAARSPSAANRAYCTTGLETLSYREMVGRVFDALAIPRRLVSLPPVLWKTAFSLARPLYPGVTSVMGERMIKDLAFDSSAAISDFGWQARRFEPAFDEWRDQLK
ncbi:MAG: NAD-dependent epimerase/dehydratase family protein [Devosia sp.]|uniref:NAD-dependent epimerase/dehydratase family protein n=1 Tax=Devosia sp. TaxID=1871048 RepID=UPI003399404A